MDILWHLQDRKDPVIAHYLSSWVGYTRYNKREQEIRGLLDLLGFKEGWLDVKENHHVDKGRYHCKYRYDQEEIRLGILKCESTQKEVIWIVCNFLAKFKLGRWAYAIQVSQNGTPQRQLIYEEPPVANYDEQKVNELTAVFRRVIDSCVRGTPDPFLGKTTCLQVHQAILTAQEKALLRGDLIPRVRFDEASTLFQNKIQPATFG
jgi:hypothetical protein